LSFSSAYTSGRIAAKLVNSITLCLSSAMGTEPGDWDLATSATPLQVKGLFKKTVDTGLKHGTVTVLLSEDDKDVDKVEITTFRVDGTYEDNRHPDHVTFTGSITEDLSRRDFTINAMAYHPTSGLIDPFMGVADIKDKIIKTVGNAGDRFREDALRMLRAVRFAARFDFELHDDVITGMEENGSLIKNISMERIRDELSGIIMSDHPEKISVLRDTGIMRHILPELEACYATPQNNPYHVYNAGEHIIKAVSLIEKDFCLRWAMLLHDIGKPTTRTTDESGIDHFYYHVEEGIKLAAAIMERLRFDNKSIKKITKLIKYHDTFIKPTCVSLRKAVSKMGKEIFPDLLKVKLADKLAQNPKYSQKSVDYINRLRFLYEKMLENKCCTSLKELAINGDDLLRLGFRQGKQIKTILDKILEAVIEEPELNKKEILIDMAMEIRNL
jgi:tRNA nucleotidyltransferase (CCA-adding enzyme)